MIDVEQVEKNTGFESFLKKVLTLWGEFGIFKKSKGTLDYEIKSTC